jgi:hypothetical protein
MVDHKDMSQYNGDEVASDSGPGDVFGNEAGHDVCKMSIPNDVGASN